MSELRLKSTRLVKATQTPCPEGGVLTHFEGQKYPVHGNPSDEALWATEMLKKYVMGWVHVLLGNPFTMHRRWLYNFYRYAHGITDSYININQLSPCVRAFHDIAMLVRPKREIEIRGFVLVLENDKYYRWVFQDLMMCVKRQELIKRPTREAIRILNIFLERERRTEYQKLRYLKPLLYLPSIRRAIRDFAKEADFTRFNMDRYDLWGALQSGIFPPNPVNSYNWGGLSYDERVEIYNKL